MNEVISPKRSRCLDTIALGLPQRASLLTRLFFAQSKIGISRTEGSVLHALSEHPSRISELACRVGVTQPAATQLVNRLEDRGWVTRSTDQEDRRVVVVELTASGRGATRRMHNEYKKVMRRHMAGLDAEELETLIRALGVLDNVIERFRGDDSPC